MLLLFVVPFYFYYYFWSILFLPGKRDNFTIEKVDKRHTWRTKNSPTRHPGMWIAWSYVHYRFHNCSHTLPVILREWTLTGLLTQSPITPSTSVPWWVSSKKTTGKGQMRTSIKIKAKPRLKFSPIQINWSNTIGAIELSKIKEGPHKLWGPF